MPEPRSRVIARGAGWVAIWVALGTVYFAAGKVGLALASLHPSASPVWPPTGIAIAAFLILGYRVWPAILVSAFLVNSTTAGSAASSLGIAIGNALEGVLGAYLAQRFAHGRRAFHRPADVLAFGVLTCLVATMVSPTIGTGSLALTGYADSGTLGPVWLTWWLGDSAGALIVAPPLILWSSDPPLPRLSRALEATLIYALVVVAGIAAFWARYPLGFVSVSALIWAALRFGPRQTATAVLLLSATATWNTVQGTGPFVRSSPNESLLLLQAYMGATTVAFLVLAAAVEQTRAAIRARDQFLSMAAHELNTPITTLRLFAQHLGGLADTGRFSDDAQLERAVRAFDRQSGRLARLVGQLLDLARIEEGRLRFDPEPSDLCQLVTEAVERARIQAPGVELVAAPPQAPAIIDPVLIDQVLANLLQNASKYSVDERPIEVSLERSTPSVWQITIRDYGIGVEPQHRERIFDRLYQARIHETSPGLGLGLYISRQIAEMHGGKLTAEFPADGGSRFIVYLPDGAERSVVRSAP